MNITVNCCSAAAAEINRFWAANERGLAAETGCAAPAGGREVTCPGGIAAELLRDAARPVERGYEAIWAILAEFGTAVALASKCLFSRSDNRGRGGAQESRKRTTSTPGLHRCSMTSSTMEGGASRELK